MDLSYERRGSGPPLVLLHGIGHHWQAFLPVLDLLAGERDVIAVDLPGFGDSPPLPEGTPYNAESLADAVDSFCRRLELGRPHVAGNSLGGYIALTLAARGAVRSATALSPAGFWSPVERFYARTVLLLMRFSAEVTPREMLEGLASSAGGRAVLAGLIVARPERLEPEALLASVTALGSAVGFEETLSSFDRISPPAPPKVPITVAWGDRDRLLSPVQGARAARWCGQRTVRLRGCGHVPMSDDPETVASVLLKGSSHPELPA